jgi:hypothetical protein
MALSAASESGRNVSLVMLTLNEEGAIKKVVEDVRRELPDAEIVVVDSSTDKTYGHACLPQNNAQRISL